MTAEEDMEQILENVILRHFRDAQANPDYPGDAIMHLAACWNTTVTDAYTNVGTYGCDSGCEYTKLKATLGCPHRDEQTGQDYTTTFYYGVFGDIPRLINEMTEEATGKRRERYEHR